MKNEIILDLAIREFEDISHDDITEMLGVPPRAVHVIGERINPKFSRIAKQNAWIMTSPAGQYDSFDVKMEMMLDIIESKKEVFKILTSRYYCEFSCGIYIYTDNEESTPWVHLNSRYHEVLKDLKIEFDVDIILLEHEK